MSSDDLWLIEAKRKLDKMPEQAKEVRRGLYRTSSFCSAYESGLYVW